MLCKVAKYLQNKVYKMAMTWLVVPKPKTSKTICCVDYMSKNNQSANAYVVFKYLKLNTDGKASD